MDSYDQAVQSLEDLSGKSIYYNNPLSGMAGGKEQYGTLEALEFAKMNNFFNSAEAQKARDFEERMSNTAYSRAAKDLESLGFSPISLFSSANSASTPSGVAASSSNSPGNKSGGSNNMLLDMVKTIGLLVLGGAKLGATQTMAASKNALTEALANRKNAVTQALAVENNLTKLDVARILKGLRR